MKKSILHFFALCALVVFFLNSCKKEELPTISTSSIAEITAISATGGGSITSDGNAEVTSRGVCWRLEPNPTIKDSKTDEGGGTGQYVSDITGLTAGTTYHVRAYATNSVGTSYGADLEFATLGNIPECLTQAATNITSSGATLNGTVNANYLSTTVTFEYGITTTYVQTVTSAQSPVTGNSIFNVSADISGLTPGTTYHFRVVATNSIGTTNGIDLTFTTGVGLPSLTTTPVSNRTSTSVTTGGTITSDGGASITARGVCWSTSPNPTVNDDYTIDGEGSGSFSSEIKCLDGGTTYYVRAYATNSEGTGYGEQESFITEPSLITFNPDLTYGTVMDIDGNCYKTIQIGDQVWMAENLRTSRYNDGSPIPNVVDSDEWGNLLITTIDPNTNDEIYDVLGAYCWYNNDSATYESVYGKLYNWGVVNTGKVCPLGWHVPDWFVDDWSPNCVENETLGGGLLETGSIHWINPYTPCFTNETGFSAVPSGRRRGDGTFVGLGYVAYFYVPVSAGIGPLVFHQMFPHSSHFCQTPFSCSIYPSEGLSIRCVKDN